MYRIVDTTTGRIERFETRGKPYLTWLLLPDGEDNINDSLCRTGRWEWDRIAKAVRLLRPETIMVDVGANCGAWALSLAHAHPRATIHAFEPQRRSFYQLCGNAFFNDLDNVRVHQVALGAPGDDATPRSLRVPEARNPGGASLVPERVHTAEAVAKMATVESGIVVRTLDSYGLDGVSILKVDVEGYEEDVLRGAVDTIRRCQPVIFFESWDVAWRGTGAEPLRRELFALIRNVLRYDIQHIDGEDFVAAAPNDMPEVCRCLEIERSAGA